MQEFDKIYAEYFAEVYKFVISLCQNPVLAEDMNFTPEDKFSFGGKKCILPVLQVYLS